MDWEALARAVVARRVELGYPTRNAFIEASGLGARTVGDVETARRPVAHSTLTRLEQALRWRPGSVQSILAGHEPRTDDGAEVTALSLDPRSLERYGDDQELLALIESSGLSHADRFRVALQVRRRRAEQHADLVRELREMLGLPDGDGPPG